MFIISLKIGITAECDLPKRSTGCQAHENIHDTTREILTELEILSSNNSSSMFIISLKIGITAECDLPKRSTGCQAHENIHDTTRHSSTRKGH
jgi:putative transposon-encoded protein